MNKEHLVMLLINTEELSPFVLPVRLKSADARPNSFSAWHLYVPSAERVICGIRKDNVSMLSLFRVRFGSVVSSLCGALYHLIREWGMAGAEHTSVTSNVDGDGVHISSTVTVGGSASNNFYIIWTLASNKNEKNKEP